MPVEATNRHIVELKYKIYEFWHKVHNRSDLYCKPRATEEPRAGLKQGHLNSQSEGLNSMENSMTRLC